MHVYTVDFKHKNVSPAHNYDVQFKNNNTINFIFLKLKTVFFVKMHLMMY